MDTKENITPLNDELRTYLWVRRDRMMYSLLLSMLYHKKRERHFDRLDRLFQTIVTASATAGVASLVAQLGCEVWILAGVALISTIHMAYNPGQFAKKHLELALEYQNLRANGVAHGEEWSSEFCNDIEAKMLRIGAKEPPQLGGLVMLCQNEIDRSRNKNAEIHIIPWYKKPFVHWIDWDVTSLNINDRKSGTQVPSN